MEKVVSPKSCVEQTITSLYNILYLLQQKTRQSRNIHWNWTVHRLGSTTHNLKTFFWQLSHSKIFYYWAIKVWFWNQLNRVSPHTCRKGRPQATTSPKLLVVFFLKLLKQVPVGGERHQQWLLLDLLSYSRFRCFHHSSTGSGNSLTWIILLLQE